MKITTTTTMITATTTIATTTPAIAESDKPGWLDSVIHTKKLKQHLLNQTNRLKRLMGHWSITIRWNSITIIYRDVLHRGFRPYWRSADSGQSTSHRRRPVCYAWSQRQAHCHLVNYSKFGDGISAWRPGLGTSSLLTTALGPSWSLLQPSHNGYHLSKTATGHRH